MTVTVRAFVRGRYGDQAVFSPYAEGGGPDWMHGSPHMALGLEDLDDATLASAPIAKAPLGIGGAASSMLTGGGSLAPVTAIVKGQAPVPVAPAESFQDPAQNGAVEQAVTQGVQQAVSGAPAPAVQGSILGAGIGGPGLGTGVLPAALRAATMARFGTVGLPPGAIWQGNTLVPTEYVRDGAWQSIASDVDRVGRETVARILGITGPQIDGIRRLLELRANQVQATSEHQTINALEQFQREVLALLRAIAIQTRSPLAAATFTGAAGRRY